MRRCCQRSFCCYVDVLVAVSLICRSFHPQVQCLLSNGNETDLGIGSSESAALRLRVPPQQVQAQQFLNLKTSQWIQAVLTLQTMR